jgi:hypothetical protein
VKRPNFEVDHDQATQPAMKKEQIDTIPLIADPQPAPTRDERKVSTQLQEERFKMKDESIF